MGQELELLVQSVRSQSSGFSELQSRFDPQLRKWAARKAALHSVPYTDVRAAADIGLWKAAQHASHTGNFWGYAQEWMHGELFDQQGWRRKRPEDEARRPLIEYWSHKEFRRHGEFFVRRWLRKNGATEGLRSILDLAGGSRGLWAALDSYQGSPHFEGNPYVEWGAEEDDALDFLTADWDDPDFAGPRQRQYSVPGVLRQESSRLSGKFLSKNDYRISNLSRLLRDVQRLPDDLMKTVLLYGIYTRRHGEFRRPPRYGELRQVATRLGIKAPPKPFGKPWEVYDPLLDHKTLRQTEMHDNLHTTIICTLRQHLRGTHFYRMLEHRPPYWCAGAEWNLRDPKDAYPTIGEEFSEQTVWRERNGTYAKAHGTARLYFPQIGLLNTPDALAEAERVIRPRQVSTRHVKDLLGNDRELPFFEAGPIVYPGRPFVPYNDDIPF